MLRALTLLLPLLAAAAPPAPEKADSTPAEMLSAATHVVLATAESVRGERSLKGGYEVVRYEVRLRVEVVEKGAGLAPGERITARCWTQRWTLPMPAPPGTNGHAPLPLPGERARAYLVNAGYNGFGTTTDGGYDLFGRNGWWPVPPLLTGAERVAAAESVEVQGSGPGLVRVLIIAFPVLLLAALIAGLGWLARARRRRAAAG